MATITITLTDVDTRGRVGVHTTEPAPEIGRTTTPAQALAMDLLRTCGKQAQRVVYSCSESPATTLVRDLIDPERFGYAVTPEVRDEARQVLGLVGRTEAPR